MTNFTVVLRGYDRASVDDLVERAEAAAASGDPARRAALRAEVGGARPTVVLRGYDRAEVDERLRRLADQLA
jgi:DivIVA domain-containing protein